MKKKATAYLDETGRLFLEPGVAADCPFRLSKAVYGPVACTKACPHLHSTPRLVALTCGGQPCNIKLADTDRLVGGKGAR